MPVQIYRNMTEEDLAAIYTYVTHVPRRVNANDKETQLVARYCAADDDCAASETCNKATAECVGGACNSAVDCGACQTCAGSTCDAPAGGSSCVTGGI